MLVLQVLVAVVTLVLVVLVLVTDTMVRKHRKRPCNGYSFAPEAAQPPELAPEAAQVVASAWTLAQDSAVTTYPQLIPTRKL